MTGRTWKREREERKRERERKRKVKINRKKRDREKKIERIHGRALKQQKRKFFYLRNTKVMRRK